MACAGGTSKKVYTLLPEHEARFGEWRDRWIANAMSTKAMTEEDRTVCREAVKGLYRSANLTPPPDHRIVFVPSPFVARFAGGFAAALWWMRKNPNNLLVTTAIATDDATDDATRNATSIATDDATAIATDDATDDATRNATSNATSDATYDATSIATRNATYDATHSATYDATRNATANATDNATYDATRNATANATYDATHSATDNATDSATYDATHSATDNATYDATRNATASRDRWYVTANPLDIAKSIAPTAAMFLLSCAQSAWRMWNGGNQYSAWMSYLSFFREVANLADYGVDYSKFADYQTLCERSGPRVMHAEFCIISDRPSVLLVDDQNRPHCETGPFCQWRDGSALYAIHGVRVPAWVVEHPERITVQTINVESNAEVQRVMLERFGFANYFATMGATKLDESDFGTLWRAALTNQEEPLMVVEVENSTAEPDGTFKKYMLPVHPELRPLPTPRNGRQFGEPQELRALNAVASTFGLTGQEYASGLVFQS